MSFSYVIALILAATVAFVTACIVASAGNTPNRDHFRRVVFSMVAVDFVLLVNWRALTFGTSWILAADLIFFTIYSAFGAAIGIVPVKATRALARRLSDGARS